MWVSLVVDAPQALHVDVGVDLCRRDGSVSEHFLHDPDVGAAPDEVGGEAVPECVGRNATGQAPAQREPVGVALDEVLDAAGAEGSAPGVQEDMTFGIAARRGDGCLGTGPVVS